MCGIIAVLRSPSTRAVPSGPDLTARLDAALASLEQGDDPATLAELVAAAANEVAEVDAALHGVPGVQALLQRPSLAGELEHRLDAIRTRSAAIESALDAGSPTLDGATLERVNAALLALKDGVWAVSRDRLRTAEAVAAPPAAARAAPAAAGSP